MLENNFKEQAIYLFSLISLIKGNNLNNKS